MRSVWSLLPEDLPRLGYRGDRASLYGRIFRSWTWEGGLPAVGRAARALLETSVDLRLPTIVEARASRDGSTKVLIELGDGARVEAVHMPRAVKRPRVTLCLSSQVGCAMGCTFCATGAMGLTRNLSAGEIVAQVVAVCRALGPERPAQLTLVFMGMGEPLHNVDEVTRAVAVLCAPEGLGVAPSRITVSTSGLVPGIERLARAAPRPLLALSLNATTDEARARTMPVTRAFGLTQLRDALARFPLARGERVTLEYVLLAGENDTPGDADRLAAWIGALPHNLNVIPFNPFAGSGFREPCEPGLEAFVRRLRDRGCLVTVRRSRGRDVEGACGVLAARSLLGKGRAQA